MSMTAIDLPPAAAAPRGRRIALVIVGKYGTLIALAIMLIYFSLASKNGAFLQPSNLLNIVNQSTLTAIIASGVTLVLVAGELDLSIGYNASLAAVLVTGLIANQGLPLAAAILVTIGAGAVAGTANGLLVTKAGINAVVATLGVGTVLVGLSFGYTAGMPIISLPAAFTHMSLGSLAGVPYPIWYMVAILAVLWVVLNRTRLGQRIQASGANRSAAHLAGVRVERAQIWAFVIAGVCAAITGILLASLLGSGTVSSADGYLLDAFAAVFLGSATLRDGEFHIVGTLIGVLIVNVGFNGLGILGTPTFYQFVFKGGILIFAVALSTIARRYAKA
jgi:ribose transport system permease protein